MSDIETYFNHRKAPQCAVCVAVDLTVALYTLLSESYYRPTFQAQSLSSSQTTSREATHTQHIEITHPHNVNTGVPQNVVLSPTQFNIYTADIPPPRAQMTPPSHLHTQARVQPRNTYNHTYIQVFFLDKTKQSHTKSRQNNLHSVHSRPCRI